MRIASTACLDRHALVLTAQFPPTTEKTMKRTSLFIILLLCAAAAVPRLSAKTSAYDSIRVAIADKPAKVRFVVMEYYADSLFNSHPTDAIPFTREAIRLAHERGDKTEEGYLLNSLSKIYLNLGEFDKSGELAREALVLNLEVKHDYEVARTYNLTAVTYNYMGLYTNAMEYSLKALQIYEQLKKPAQAATMLNAIGTIYLRLGHYEQAHEYFTRALRQKKDTTTATILVLNNLAAVKIHQGYPDSALMVLTPLLSIARQLRDKGAESYTLFNIGSAYGAKNDYRAALEFLFKARQISSSIHEARGEAEASLGIAQVYAKRGDSRKALAVLNDAIPYCKRAKAYDFLRTALDLQRSLYGKTGDVRNAYASLMAYTALTDSVYHVAEKFGVSNAVFSSDLALKENEILRLKEGAVMNAQAITTKQFEVYALGVFLIILISAAVALVFMYRKANTLRKTEITQKLKIERLYEELSSVVTERKLADDQARESQLKFQAVWEKSVDGMRLTDSEGIVLMVNEAFCRMVGMDREALTGKPLSVIYDKKLHEQTVHLYKERFASRKVERYFERELLLKDGRSMWFEVTNTYITIEAQPTILLGIFRDVTHRKRLEHQLVQSQKIEGLGTLAGGIAHDFNNLLAMILGSAEMLRMKIADQPQLQKYVDRIVEASARGTSISRQLLIFSRPDQAQLKPITLSQTIAELQEMLKHFLPKSIAISTTVLSEGDTILGDSGQIQQALLNLAINAGDAMINRGTLTIKEAIADAAAVRQKFPRLDAPAYVALSVTDTGTGMTEDVKQKIFDPFFTTKERSKGTGLGLSSVHGIVKNHGGVIDVASVPGLGSTFTIYFPIAAAPVIHNPEAKIVQGAHYDETILLVDDEVMIRETTAEFLTSFGYTVFSAAGGREALELYRTHADTLDIVVTDLGMPEMGGEELYVHLRAIDPDVKVIVSSGYLDGTSKKELLKIGVKDVLTKPVKIHDLHTAIEAVLHPL
jgi:PAS domain S-box-containing protein